MNNPCILLPWLAPAVCPEHTLPALHLFDLSLPIHMSRADIPLFSVSLPLDEDAVKAYLKQIKAITEDPQSLSATMFTHLDVLMPHKSSMSRDEQTQLENFVTGITPDGSAKSLPKQTSPKQENKEKNLIAAHMGLLCAALSQDQQAEMATLIKQYHDALTQFSTSIHGEDDADRNKDSLLHPAHNFFDVTSEPMHWRYILERMVLFVPEKTIFILDTNVLTDVPEIMLQPLTPELYEYLPKIWSKSMREQLTGTICPLRHVLDTATKSLCSEAMLDTKYLFIAHSLTQN